MYSVDHVSIVTNNLEESIKFYNEVLGFEVVGTEETEDLIACYLKVEHLIIELMQGKNKVVDRPNAGVIDHLAFRIDNFDEEYERLTSLGVKMLYDIMLYDDKKFTFFSGPSGERIEISEK
ncbi:lactoylglutathione lyase [Clostridium cavendishii DSM 21758]|uniref:Lactoylglutathione lyase n=1 Tax=Clostridium cavendishii DSM 21758 TaxID=1121302 RepID=A0A1M6FAD2_9CLOT|nr:VOC family protein [Clostridium cavendishii]SHI94714.1 lactoylglutathione lyase [Clostridium cavendishii DSM 21758]